MSSFGNHNKQNLEINRYIFLDSTHANTKFNSTKLSDVLFFLDNQIYSSTQYDMCLKFISANFPISFYNINSTNNTINFLIGATPYNFTIAIGNYNAYQLRDEINNLISATTLITCTYTTIQNKFTFTRAGANTFTYVSTSLSQSLLGFNSGNRLSSLVGGNNVLISDNVINLTYTNNIKIAIENITTYNVDSSSNGGVTSVVKIIPIDVLQNEMLSFNDFGESSYKLKDKFLSYFQIKIYDDNNNLIDFNNCNWDLCFEVYFANNGEREIKVISKKEIEEKVLENKLKFLNPSRRNI